MAHHCTFCGAVKLYVDDSSGLQELCCAQSDSQAEVPRPSGSDFQLEVVAVAEEVAGALHQLGLRVHTEIGLSGPAVGESACTLTAQVSKEHLPLTQHFIAVAKESIFERTGRGRGVCLLGFKATPFKSTSTGFCAQLATVAPKRQACKKLYSEGFCKHGHDCRQQHPVSIVTFHLEIVAV